MSTLKDYIVGFCIVWCLIAVIGASLMGVIFVSALVLSVADGDPIGAFLSFVGCVALVGLVCMVIDDLGD